MMKFLEKIKKLFVNNDNKKQVIEEEKAKLIASINNNVSFLSKEELDELDLADLAEANYILYQLVEVHNIA